MTMRGEHWNNKSLRQFGFQAYVAYLVVGFLICLILWLLVR